MFSSSSVALLAFSLSAAARVQIESRSSSFFNAGIQGCISAEDNNVTPHDWEVSFFNKFEVVGEQIKVFGDKCIDVTGGVNADGTKLQIWTCDAANANQKWNSVQDETFQWTGTNKCIDLTDGKITDGNQLQIWTCDSNSANQGWSGGNNGNITWVYPKAPLSGTISTFNNKCLDVPNGSTANGVKLQIWTCAEGNTNQRFKVVSNQIQWVGTTKCLDLPGGSSTAKNPIQLWDCDTANANPNQKWFI
ncbi:ricin B lectin domain-containing protein [Mycena vulgaris]|nr:ricin B lectin domain-containing protein [Mycena vulgaris]